MAISPTSDLILDVARAADPQRATATTRALSGAGAGAGADATTQFAKALDNVAVAPPPPSRDYSYRNPIASTRAAVETPEHKAAVGLESVLLKSLVDQMLPKDSADVFGQGVAGDVWKSMLAEKIANEVAKSGSLKLGSRLFATHPALLHSTKKNVMAFAPPAPSAPRKI